MRALRSLAAVALAGGAIYLAYAFCWAPAICNHIERRLQALVMTAVDASAYRAPVLARTILDGVRECHDRCAPNTDIAMIKAASERLVGRPADAVRTYQSALRYASRPELYLNLGLALAEDHRREEAVKALMTAIEAAPSFSDGIPDGELKFNVENAIRERNRQLRQGKNHD
jgi:tetratricopeptide (TPR) repeat protein